MPTFRGPDGKVIDVPDEQAHSYEARGYTPIGDVAAGAAQNQIAPVDNGIAGSIGATLSSGLSGTTLGASDWLLKGALTPGGFKQMAQDRADNPGLAGAAQFAGALVPAVVSGGSITPTGYLSHIAAEGIGAAEEVGGAVGAARSLAIAGSEGAIQNAGAYLSDVALGDRDLTAEGMVGALGTGFAFGGGGLVAAHGIAAGTMAARRMFARYASGGEQAANDARMAWQEQSAKALESFDQAATAAQAKLQEAQLARQQADLARKQASASVAEAKIAPPPEVSGGAGASASAQVSPDIEIAGLLHDRAMSATDPQRMAAWDAQNGSRLQELVSARQAQPPANPLDALAQAPGVKAYGPETLVREHGYQRVPGATPAEADLSAKLAEYQGARAAFHDIHAQVDPDLDEALRGLGTADVQRPPVPVGEFGAPGARGYDPGNVAAPGPPGAVEAVTGDVTAVRKKNLAEGTPITSHDPTRAFDIKDSGLSFEPETRSYHDATSESGSPEGIPERARVAGRYKAAPTSPAPTPLSDEEFSRTAESAQSQLSEEERQAAIAYSRNGLYAQINAPLRRASGKPGGGGLKPIDEHLHGRVKALDSAVGKSPAPRDMVTYRGVNDEAAVKAIKGLKPGDTYIDPGFVSTSHSPDIGKDYTQGFGVRSGVEIRVTVPKGYPALPIPSEFPKEREILLGRGGHFSVTGRSVAEDGHTILEMTARPPPKVEPVKLPEHFVLEAKDSQGQPMFNADPDVITGIPQYSDIPNYKVARDAAYIVRPSELAEVGVVGRADAAAEAWNGASVPAIEIKVHRGPAVDMGGEIGWVYKTGGYSVTDGSKRLLAAAAAGDRPVLVRFAPALSAADENAASLAGKIRSAVGESASAKAAAPASDLLSQLQGTAAKIGEGNALGEISASSPARAEYVAKRAAKQVEDAAYFRAKAVAKRSGAKPVVESFSVKHPHLGDVDLRLSAKTSAESGRPMTTVEVTRRTSYGEDAPVATAEFSHRNGSLYPEHVVVDQPFQRMGIGTRAYQAAERSAGMSVTASADQTSEGAAFSQKFRKRAEDLKSGTPPETEAFFAELKRPKTWHDYAAKNIQKAMREEGSHAAAMDRLKGEWATMQGGRDAHPLAAKKLEMAHDAAVERAAAATDPAVRREAQAEAQSIEKQMTSVGARPGAVEDVAVMAPVVHRLEKAAAELTETLGADAPAVAKDHAAAFRKAEDAADSKSMSRAARAADDHAAAQERARSSDMVDGPSARERAVAAAKRQRAEAEAAYQKSRVAEAEASIGAKRAKIAAGEARSTLPPAPSSTKPAASGAGNRVIQGAHAIGYAAELGSDLGIPGIPRPHDIPVIGPLLSAYLKYRAFRAAAGRFVGRIPATAETRAAELAARTRDGVARAVDRSLGLIERNPTAVRTAVTIGAIRANEALSRRMVDDGHPDAPAGASVSQLAAVRMREVAAAVANPALITDKVRAESRAIMDPELITALENHLVAMFQHLNDTAPKGPPPNPYTKQEWKPPPADALQWGQRLAVANNPQVAFEMLQAGTLTPPAADTLRIAYAKLFAEAQQRIIARASDLKNPVPYRQLMQNALLFNVPLHPSLDPENAAVLRTAHAPSPPAQTAQAQPPQPSIAGPTNVDNLYQTTADRRAAR